MGDLSRLEGLEVLEVSLVKRGANMKRVALTKESDEMTEEVKKDETEVKKEVSPEIADQLESLRKEAEELKSLKEAQDKVNEELKKQLQEVKDAAETKELIEKSAKELKHVPGEVEETAVLLKKARDAGFEDDLTKVLKAMSDQLAQSEIFKTQGRTSTVSEAADELEGKIKEFMKANPGLTHPQCMVRVLKAEPELKARIRKESN
jgi:predicted RNase H-like nuclease (RuvC/YqgF family)